MADEIILEIESLVEITEENQNLFIDKLIDLIEKFNLRAGGAYNLDKLSWVISSKSSELSKGEIIDEIGYFLMQNDDFEFNFNIY